MRGELYEELRAAAFECLLLNPGCGYAEWERLMRLQYPAEVADCFGPDPRDASRMLSLLWEKEYEDPATRLAMTYRQWARMFSGKEGADIYYRAAGARESAEGT